MSAAAVETTPGVGARLARCALCDETPDEPAFPDARGPARAHPLVRCRCGLVFLKRLPTAAEAVQAHAAFYGEPSEGEPSRGDSSRRFRGVVEVVVRRLRLARARLAAELLPAGGGVLDVGCGRGLFLREMKDRGFRVQGTELSAETAANAIHGVRIDVCEVGPGTYDPGAFHLATIWHVLEHLRDPGATLAGCFEALAPGGALLVAVPNFDSFQARFGGERWFHLDLPRHVWHFTPGTLRALLESRGFEVESLRTGQWEMDPFGLLQTALNRSGLRHNALFDALSTNPAVRRDVGPVLRAAMLAAFVLGLPLAGLASLLFRLRGRAGTLIAVARKPEAAA